MRPIHELTIGGKVERFAVINPQYVQLRGPVGSEVGRWVSISPEEKYPFKILDVRLKSGKYVKATFEERENPKGKPLFAVRLENLKTDPGRYYDQVLLDTDSPVRPTLAIAVYGQITEPRKAPDKEVKPKPAVLPKSEVLPPVNRPPGKGDSMAMD